MKALEENPPSDDRAAVFGLATWRAVYWVVLAFLVLWVALLTLLPRLFS